MGLGGPVWHVSVMPRRLMADRDLLCMARKVLDGVGDRRRGEWMERHGALHLRRRLSQSEELLVGPVVDIRGTDEAKRRAEALPPEFLARVPAEVLVEEIGP